MKKMKKLDMMIYIIYIHFNPDITQKDKTDIEDRIDILLKNKLNVQKKKKIKTWLKSLNYFINYYLKT